MKHTINSFTLQDISTCRSALMGIAILWVVFYHFGFHTPIISHVTRFGYTGVDIFMFLSGFGLFYSLQKKQGLSNYFKKRVMRIFPSYFLVGITLSLFCYPNENFWDYLWRCSTFGFWTNGIYYEWFIPAIIALYCLFPLAFRILACNRIRQYKFLIVCCLIFSAYAAFNYTIVDNWHFLLLYRIPIFLFGALTAFYIAKQYSQKEYNWIGIIGVFIFIGFFIIPELRTRYIAFTFLTPLIISISCICVKNITIINKWGGVIGKASLEIYLVHLVFLKYLILNPIDFRENYFDLSTIILSTVSVLIGITLHKLIVKCIHI